MRGATQAVTIALLLMLARTASAADLRVNPSQIADHQIADQWSVSGDGFFRQSRFEEAADAYARAIKIDSRNVVAHMGMGKLASLLSDHASEAQHLSAAYQIAPLNPDVILAYAGVVEDRAARMILLRNFLTLAVRSSTFGDRIEDVKARLRIEEQLGSRVLSKLESVYQPIRIPLASLPTGGFVLQAYLNSGRELRLIVDTGATGIVLNASAACDLQLEYLAPAALVGFGGKAPAAARVALAANLRVGTFQMSNVLVNVGSAELVREADGVVGLDVFKDYLIQLDARSRHLQLTPFPASASSTECTGCVRANRLGHLLLVRGSVNGTREGYFILDTGSPKTIVSKTLMPASTHMQMALGIQGAQPIALPTMPVSLRVGTQHILDFETAAIDTAEISAHNGTEIAGAIGYSVLRDLNLMVDYQHGFVKLGKSGGR